MSTQNITPTELSITREAMDRSERNANPDFNTFALELVRLVAQTKPELTTEDVRIEIEKGGSRVPVTHDMSAIGPVMVRAEQVGYIEKIEGRAVKSSRPSSHGRLLRVFKSNLYITAPQTDQEAAA